MAAFRDRVQTMLTAEQRTLAPSAEVGNMVCGLCPGLNRNPERLGHAKPAPAAKITKLDEFLNDHLRTLEIKPNTLINYGQARRQLVAYFGKDKPLAEITPADADCWRQYLKGKNLSESTINRRAGVARQMFRRAVKWKLLDENPFADVKMGSQINRARMFFITPQMAEQVIAACSDPQWKLLFALSRYGGLRCPSEHLLLKWCDIDWNRHSICVHSPKTEHHAGGDQRYIPLFPELRFHLQAVFADGKDSGSYVITRYRQPNVNLRTQLYRHIKKAGLKPWPRLFHNLRSSRQTELCETFPIHVVCLWMGNSRAVAQEHYLQTTDLHFLRAAGIAVSTTSVSNEPVGEGELAIVLAAWPNMPAAIQHRVLGLVEAAGLMQPMA